MPPSVSRQPPARARAGSTPALRPLTQDGPASLLSGDEQRSADSHDRVRTTFAPVSAARQNTSYAASNASSMNWWVTNFVASTWLLESGGDPDGIDGEVGAESARELLNDRLRVLTPRKQAWGLPDGQIALPRRR